MTTNLEAVRRYQAANPEKVRESRRRYDEANREKKLEFLRRWRAANPDRHRTTYKRWCIANPHKVLAYQHKRRALKKGSGGGDYTVQQWVDLVDTYDNRCVKCWRRCKPAADHVIPLSKGGSNHINNIQPLCKSCNSSKGTKTRDYR